LLQDADTVIVQEKKEKKWIPSICKYHQLHNLKTKEISSKSELFTHTKAIFAFLLTELTKLATSLQTIQLLE